MKRTFALAALALAAANTAMAVPIYLDFTGKITDSFSGGAPSGTAVSGSFTFETDDMGFGEYLIAPPSFRQLSFGLYSETGFPEPIATFDVGGQQTTFGFDPGVTYGYVGFVDVCVAGACLPGWGENFGWFAQTNNFGSGTDGTFTQRTLGLMAANTAVYPDYPFIEYLDYFDGDDLTVMSGVTLPLYQLSGFYSEDTVNCVAGNCTPVDGVSYNLSIDSVQRGIGARAVPEPGMFGLFAAALGLLVFFRRRRAAPI
jgi:hypothetical protein